MLLNDDVTRLRHIIEATQEAMGYAQGLSWDEFQGSRPLQHAVVRCIEIIGEASSRISKECRDSNPQVPWVDIVAMRNRIVHAYYDIDIAVVWKTVTEDLPAMLPEIQGIVRGLMDPK
jgi:uncharacterized protein with HEPN domain